MPLTVNQRFFISTDVAHDGARLHAVLRDDTSLLLVLKNDPNGWYLTFDHRTPPADFMRISRVIAALVLRRHENYVYPVTRLQPEQLNDVARSICEVTRIIGVERNRDAPYIDAGTRLWARIGSNPQFGVPREFQRCWRADMPLASLIGHPVRTARVDQTQS